MYRFPTVSLIVAACLLAAGPLSAQDCFDYGSGLPHVVQSISLPAGSVDGIARDGDGLVVASGADLYWFRLDAAGSPSLEGRFTLPYTAANVDLGGTLVVAAHRSSGLSIVDFADPSAPVLRAAVPSLSDTRDVAIDGSLVTMAENSGGLRVLDISDPGSPVQIFSSGHVGITHCAADAGFCWEFNSQGRFWAYDLRDPAAPAQIWYLDDFFYYSYVITAACSDGLLRYTRGFAEVDMEGQVINEFNAQYCLDVSDPAAPLDVALSVGGDYVYRTGTDEVCILTQSDQILISGMGATNGERQVLDTPGITGPLAERGGLLYGGIGGALVVIDPERSVGSPQLFAFTPLVVNGGILSWDVVGNLSFMHIHWYDAWSFEPDYSYILVTDMTDPANPVTLATQPFWIATSGYFGCLNAYGDYLYTGLGTYNWRTDTYLSSFAAKSRDIVIGDALYRPDSAGLLVYDLADPAAPVLSATLFAGTDLTYEPIVQADGVAYIRTIYHNKWQIAAIDVGDPLAPVVLDYLSLSARPLDAAAGVLYLNAVSELVLVDVADPTAMVQAGSLPLTSSIDGLAARGDMFYLGTEDQLLQTGLATDPYAPTLLPAYDLARRAGDFRLVDKALLTLNPTTLYAMTLDCGDPGPGYVAAVEETPGTTARVPAGLLLAQPHPNPFNPDTTIRWQVLRAGPVEVGVYDLGGRLLRTLVSRPQAVGSYGATWNGRDEAGRVLPSGTYLVGVRRGAALQTRKITLIK